MKLFNLVFLFSFTLLMFCLDISNCRAQDVSELNKKRKQIEENIKRINNLISDNNQSQKLVSKDLMLNKQKLILKNQLIKQIENEIVFIEKEISLSNKCIDSLTLLLSSKNDEFAQVIQKSFKNRNDKYLILYILSAQSFNQSYVRLKFYKQIMAYQNEKLLEIKTIINERSVQTANLQDNVKSLKNKQYERLKEAEILRDENVAFNQKINTYRKKERQLNDDLKNESEKARVIESEIKRLIAEELKKRQASKKTKEVDIKLSKNFSENFGLFPSPVKNGIITGTFGESFHPVLTKVKIKNNGIDINVPRGNSVYSIFDGEVSKIFNVPLSGVALIIRHGNYMTVYSNLCRVIVKVGDKVSKSQKIADVECGDAQNGTLHFEIWNERSPENPTKWLYEFK